MGRITKHHGLDGELRVRSYSDNPHRFQPGQTLSAEGVEHTIISHRPLPDGLCILRLDGVATLHAARQLSGRWLYAVAESAPELEPGEYYHYQLVGLSVTADDGEHLGKISEVLATGSNDVYVVAGNDGSELLLPAVQQVIKDIDLAAGNITVHLISGLR